MSSDKEEEFVQPKTGLQDGNAMASLAILSVNIAEKRWSYLDHFIPFVIEALESGCNGKGGSQEVADALKVEFGLQIPQPVVKNILRRAVESSKIDRPSGEDFYIIRPGAEKERTLFQSLRSEALRQQNSLAKNLAEFSNSKYGLTWSTDEAEQALQEFVQQISTDGIQEVLGSAKNSSREVRANEGVTKAFVVGEYITNIVESDPIAFNSLENLVKGSMLAATLYLPGSVALTNKFRETTIWIDAPLALQWLGFGGEESQRSVESLMNLALQQDARLGMFSHSVRELRGIVTSATEGIDNYSPDYHPNPVTIRFRSEGVTKAEGRIRAQTLERELNKRKVIIEDSPEINPKYAIDENSLETLLQERVGYLSPSARACDRKSLVAVHQLRRGESSELLERSRAVMVTANNKLATVSKIFFDRPSKNWPEAIVDHELAALLWTKSPASEPDLPRKQIIADALAALRPSGELWESYNRALIRFSARGIDLTSEILVLRNDSEAQRLLVDYSHGNPNNLTAEIIQKVLVDITESNVAPVRAELAAKNHELKATQQGLESSGLELNEYRKRIEKLENADEYRKQRAIDRSKRWGDFVTKSFKRFTVVLFIAAALSAVDAAMAREFPALNTDYILPPLLKGFFISAALAVFLVDLVFKLTGKTYFGLAKSLGDKTQRFIQMKSFRVIGADTTSELETT